MNEPIIPIPIEKITAIEEYLIRFDKVDESGINRAYLKDLKASDPSIWPPIYVTSDGDGGYELVDGYHRLTAATELEVGTINSVVLPRGDREIAFALNLKHGLHLTVKDRKEHARYLHEEHPDMSEREIARRTHLDHGTVSKAIMESDGENRQPEEDTLADQIAAVCRERRGAVRSIFNAVNRLWKSAGLGDEYGNESSIKELAAGLRADTESKPEFNLALVRLKALVDMATRPA